MPETNGAGAGERDRSEAEMLARVEAVAAELADLDARRHDLVEERTVLFERLRALEPPALYRTIAAAAGFESDEAVSAAVKRRAGART